MTPATPDGRVDILLVDDSAKNLLALESILEGLDANLVKAASGKDALLYLLEHDVALILLDISMPELDGFETASLIRQRERTRHVPIIFLTAFNKTDAQVFRGYALGAVDYLFKPFVPEVLKAKVLVFLELHRKTVELRRHAELLREAERREGERRLAAERQRWIEDRLRDQMEEKRVEAELLAARAEELARHVKERQKAEDAMRRSNQRLRLLADSASRLLVEVEPQRFVASIFADLSSHLGLEIWAVALAPYDGEAGRTIAIGGIDESIARDALVHLPHKLVHEDLVQSTNLELARLRAAGVTAILSWPLLASSGLIGTVCLGTRHRTRFDPDELAVIGVVCDQVSVALERARLNGELEVRATLLAEADRRKDEFLAMLAHELRNPLAPLLNAAEILRLRGGEDPVVVRAQATMERQVRHMTRLVDDLLDVSRINSGKIELRRERIELAQVLDLAVQTAMPLIKSRRHELSVEAPAERALLFADATRLAQIIANLLNNAAKYTEPGGHLLLRVERRQEELVVSVRDDGIGIAPDMLGRVFDLFVQAERAADRAQGGLGIGLTLVKRLVEMHGGSISARSDGPGRGSEFTARMPIVVEAGPIVETAAGSPPPAMPPPGKLRVLIVDDNVDVRETLRDVLELAGWEVELAADGREAVDKVLSSRPNVALIDVGLPGLDGYGVAQTLRASMSGEPTRLVAITGYGRPEDRRRALEAGFDAHLVKPVDVDSLSRLLRGNN